MSFLDTIGRNRTFVFIVIGSIILLLVLYFFILRKPKKLPPPPPPPLVKRLSPQEEMAKEAALAYGTSSVSDPPVPNTERFSSSTRATPPSSSSMGPVSPASAESETGWDDFNFLPEDEVEAFSDSSSQMNGNPPPSQPRQPRDTY